MPHSRSAKKRLRQSITRNLYNKSVTSAIKTQRKKFLAAVAAGNVEVAETEFRKTVKAFRKAAAKKVVHTNAAGRVESRLAVRLNALKGKQPAA
jgi:small subunit ribosomal protein S20